MAPNQRKLYSRVSALFAMSLVMGWDLLLELFCARLPLLLYLVAGGLGGWIGWKCAVWLAGDGGGRKLLRAFAILVCVMGLLGAGVLSYVQPRWSSHCGFRYCGRALGVGLWHSPFPVGTPSCRDLHMCANEHIFTEMERDDLYELIAENGCEPP